MERCRTKYPILLLHGTGFRDRKYLNYWGRIPAALESRGALIFYGGQDSWGTIESNCAHLMAVIEEIFDKTGCEKLNLIAHSKGGLEARYLISSLGMAERIASLTTIATPHHGSRTMDRLSAAPPVLHRAAGMLVNLWFRLLGDRNPDFYRASLAFTTRAAEAFNQENPDMPTVYYQSFAAVMNGWYSDLIMAFPYLVIHAIEGECDGMVSVASARWSNFRGVLRADGRRGISHPDEVDMRRRPFRRTKQGQFDIVNVYLNIVEELKDKGF